MKVVMDSDVLIKFTKTGCKEAIVSLLEVSIPDKVYEETFIEPKGCLDAIKIQENIDNGMIQVQGLPSRDKGELEALKLYKSGGFELIASDDRKFLNSLDQNGIPYLTSSSMVVYLLYNNKISQRQYLAAMLEVLKWVK
jgi:hypothetical protein